jgi:hypothetical protein
LEHIESDIFGNVVETHIVLLLVLCGIMNRLVSKFAVVVRRFPGIEVFQKEALGHALLWMVLQVV